MSEPKQTNDGGPAFPCPVTPTSDGMTLRAYFAGQALAGMLAKHGRSGLGQICIAEAAVAYADALIAELQK